MLANTFHAAETYLTTPYMLLSETETLKVVYRVRFNRHCLRRAPACMPTMWGWCRSQHSACLCAHPSHSAAAELPGRLGLQQSVECPSRMGGHPTEEAHGYRLTPDKSCKLLRTSGSTMDGIEHGIHISRAAYMGRAVASGMRRENPRRMRHTGAV